MTCTSVTGVAGVDAFQAVERPVGSFAGLLSPATIAGVPVQTGFAMAPMTRFRSPGGIPTDEVAAYYRRRAEAGVGLIITEGVHVDHPTAGDHPAVPRMAEWSSGGWRNVVQEVHAAGGKIFAQLWHLGSERQPVDDLVPWTPSGVGANMPAHVMTIRDIDHVVAAFAEAGRIAQSVGFDGVEIHGAHGYLVDEFLWTGTNRREDEYGGRPANRARLAADIVRAIRDNTAAEFPIMIRMSQFKEREFGARVADSPAELAALLEPIVQAGANAVHASQRRFWEPAFPGSTLNLAGWAKLLTGLDSVTVGSIGLTRTALMDEQPWSLSALAARFDRGEFDLVAIGRALLANPRMIELLATGNQDRMTEFSKEYEDIYF